jgi:hypothetical protein
VGWSEERYADEITGLLERSLLANGSAKSSVTAERS